VPTRLARKLHNANALGSERLHRLGASVAEIVAVQFLKVQQAKDWGKCGTVTVRPVNDARRPRPTCLEVGLQRLPKMAYFQRILFQ